MFLISIVFFALFCACGVIFTLGALMLIYGISGRADPTAMGNSVMAGGGLIFMIVGGIGMALIKLIEMVLL